jgi:hypothetical protein
MFISFLYTFWVTVPIIRRNNCICVTPGIFISSCIPDSHPHTVTNTSCHIDTVISPDDGHIVTQNIERKEINILRKIVQQVGFIYKKILLLLHLTQF